MSDTATKTKTLPKHDRHAYYWIEDGVLYETYSTFRGPRWRYVMAVPFMMDNNRLSAEDIAYIEKDFLK